MSDAGSTADPNTVDLDAADLDLPAALPPPAQMAPVPPPDAEQAFARLARLQTLCLALSAAVTLRQAAHVVVTEGFAALEALQGSVYLLQSDGNDPQECFLRVAHTGSDAPSIPPPDAAPADEQAGEPTYLNLAAPGALAEALRLRHSLFVEALPARVAEASAASPLPADTSTAAPVPAELTSVVPATVVPASADPDSTLLSFAAAPTAPFDSDSATRALAALPLWAEERVVGGIELHWTEPRRFDMDTRAFMRTVAQICAQMLERARLYEAEQRARQQAEQARERSALLQSVTARLSQSLSLEEVGGVIVDSGASVLGAHRGVLALLTASGDSLEVARAMGYQARIAQAWRQFPLDAPIPLADAVRERRAIWIHDLAERDARYPQLARIQTSSHAYAVVPLIARGRAMGAISFGFDHARGFDEADRVFISSLAQHCALALERARLHDTATRTLAHIETLNARLSRSMAETHHRVKNNLQVVSALVDLQTDGVGDTVPTDALRRVGIHARALATLHDLLTDQARATADTNTVSARALIDKMLPLLRITTAEHRMQAYIEEFRLPVRVGASLCLLINELVSNAVKHGGRQVSLSLTLRAAPEAAASLPAPIEAADFDARLNGLLSTALPEAETGAARVVCLQVEDDGPGFPPGFDVRRAANTGLDLVVNISRLDMGGQVVFANTPSGGAQVSITFAQPEN